MQVVRTRIGGGHWGGMVGEGGTMCLEQSSTMGVEGVVVQNNDGCNINVRGGAKLTLANDAADDNIFGRNNDNDRGGHNNEGPTSLSLSLSHIDGGGLRRRLPPARSDARDGSGGPPVGDGGTTTTTLTTTITTNPCKQGGIAREVMTRGR